MRLNIPEQKNALKVCYVLIFALGNEFLCFLDSTVWTKFIQDVQTDSSPLDGARASSIRQEQPCWREEVSRLSCAAASFKTW